MRAILVPTHPAKPVEIIAVEPGFENLARAIGGPCRYIERFHCPLTPYHNLVGVIDEDGQYNGQHPNQRAWPLYPLSGYTLAGPVLVMAEKFDPLEGADFCDLPDPDQALALVVDLLERTHHA